MLEVRTHVLAPYDDLKLCRKLYETESPNCVSQIFQGGIAIFSICTCSFGVFVWKAML